MHNYYVYSPFLGISFPTIVTREGSMFSMALGNMII